MATVEASDLKSFGISAPPELCFFSSLVRFRLREMNLEMGKASHQWIGMTNATWLFFSTAWAQLTVFSIPWKSHLVEVASLPFRWSVCFCGKNRSLTPHLYKRDKIGRSVSKRRGFISRFRERAPRHFSQRHPRKLSPPFSLFDDFFNNLISGRIRRCRKKTSTPCIGSRFIARRVKDEWNCH